MIKEHPILFSGEMVRAILEGRKTQTRRIVSGKNSAVDARKFADIELEKAVIHSGISVHGYKGNYLKAPHKSEETGHRIYPRYETGDRLWVRETWQIQQVDKIWDEDGLYQNVCIDYPASAGVEFNRKWYKVRGGKELSRVEGKDSRALDKPSIFMPRWASRITLEITNIRVERLQDISEEDAKAEGMSSFYAPSNPPQIDKTYGIIPDVFVSARECFIELWDIINGKRAPWHTSPFVWVIEFRRVK